MKSRCKPDWSTASAVQAVADGADVIFHTFSEQFALWPKANFTADDYHVDEHLTETAEVIAPNTKHAWLHQQHERLLANKVSKILEILEKHFEPPNKKRLRCAAFTSTSTNERTISITPEPEPRDCPLDPENSKAATGMLSSNG